MHVCVVAFQLACFVCFLCICSTSGTHLVGADSWRVPLLGRSAAPPAPALDVSVAPASFSVQVRLAPVPSAQHPRLGPPRIDPSARTPLDVGLLGLAPSDRPLGSVPQLLPHSAAPCCTLLYPAALCCTLLCLLSCSRAWHSTLGLCIFRCLLPQALRRSGI